MGNMRVRIEEAISSIEQTTDKFYQNKTEDGYNQLGETISILTETINEIYEYKMQGNEIGIDENALVEVLTEAMNAMENKDMLLLADILQYELKGLFEKVILS